MHSQSDTHDIHGSLTRRLEAEDEDKSMISRRVNSKSNYILLLLLLVYYSDVPKYKPHSPMAEQVMSVSTHFTAENNNYVKKGVSLLLPFEDFAAA